MYITVSATVMLTSWLETRPMLWFEPLKIASRLTPISSSMAISSWASMCAVSVALRRLTSRGIGIEFFHFDRRGFFAQQVIIQHFTCDRCRSGCAKAGVLH